MRPHENPEIWFCIMGPEVCKDSLCGPVPLLLKFPDDIVVYTSVLDSLPDDVVDLTPPDSFGNKLSRIPVKYVDRFMTQEDEHLWHLENGRWADWPALSADTYQEAG